MAVELSWWHFTSLHRKSKAREQLLLELSSRFVDVERRDPFRKGLPATWLLVLLCSSGRALQVGCSPVGRYLPITCQASNRQIHL